MTFPAMRSQVELQRVHDMLMDVLSDAELSTLVIPDYLEGSLRMAANCLCWALHHDGLDQPDTHATQFAGLLQGLRNTLALIGHTWEAPGECVVEED